MIWMVDAEMMTAMLITVVSCAGFHSAKVDRSTLSPIASN
jgi:hypothetical protein